MTIIRDANSSWKIDADTKKTETVSNPLPGGCFVIESKKGAPIRATKEQLAQTLSTTPPETHRIVVTAGTKGARCFADITGTRIAKTEWGNKIGNVQSAQIVEKMGMCVYLPSLILAKFQSSGSHALVAFTDTHEALTFSLPQLEHLCTLKLSADPSAL